MFTNYPPFIAKSLLTMSSLLVCLSLFSVCGKKPKPAIRFNEDNSGVDLKESMLYSRCLTWRPGDRDKAALNPPRFSWPYEPEIIPEELPEGSRGLPVRSFSFQVALDPGFDSLLVDIRETPFNFYNTIAPFPEGRAIYWRAGYYNPRDKSSLEWRKTRTFTVQQGAATWDRSPLARPGFTAGNHPRIIYTRNNLGELRDLYRSNPRSSEIREDVLSKAGSDLGADWFIGFPEDDSVPEDSLRELFHDLPSKLDPDGGDLPYLFMFERLTNMAFAWVLTGEQRYLAVIDRFVALASYPPGGPTSPEGIGGSEDYGVVTEFLSLFYDWFYDELSPDLRKEVLAGLRWRTDHIVNSYSWHQRKGKVVYPYSIAVAGSSHPYENINTAFPAGLAAYEEGGVFRTTYDLAVNFLTGVSNCFGPEDAWNEGPGYGTSKYKWLIDATCYYDMTLENAGFGKNPFLHAIGDFFTRAEPLGLPHLSFGNIGIMEPYYLGNRLSTFRKLAYLTGNRLFLENWEDTIRRTAQIGYSSHRKFFRPWIEYALPYLCGEPVAPAEKPPMSRLFADGGWVAASTRYAGKLDNYPESLGIIFHARPRGAFNHSFYGDNSFQIYAYGRNVTHAGGSTQNGDRHGHHSMSQNIVLVDGLGQSQPSHTRMSSFRKSLHNPWNARIARYSEQDGTVYFKGEAANAYIRFPHRTVEFWGELGDGKVFPYRDGDLSYLEQADRHVVFVDGRYFVMLDELAVSESQRPQGSRFSWLYHVLQDVPLHWDKDTQTFSYTVDGVSTVVRQVSLAEPIAFEDRKGADGLINPLTGEDYREFAKKITLYDKTYTGPYPETVTHNIWITNREPAHRMRFVTVIYPYKEGSDIPRIERVDDLTVRVSCGGNSETVTFDPEAHPQAEVQVGL
jgi:hypothetical protein